MAYGQDYVPGSSHISSPKGVGTPGGIPIEEYFRIASHDAFEKGLRAAGMVLLEPIMRLVITTPDEFLGEFVGDLQQRRAIIDKTEMRGNMAIITAKAPLKELFGYSSAI